MKLKWLGHSCFLVISLGGTRIVTDPFDNHVGYQLPSVEADLVTTSHKHMDHANTQAIKGDFIVLDKTGEHNISGMKVMGISSFHDEAYGAQRGSNIIFVFEVDGLRVCHCGALAMC